MQRLLIVEDDLAYGTILQTWLRKKSFDVERVTGINAAKTALEQGDFDLVLSDFRLPDGDGLQLLEHIRHQTSTLPFILMTGYADVQHAVLAMKSGAADYIAKPCQPDILLTKIREALHTGTSQPATTGASPVSPQYLEGKSEVSRRLYDEVRLVAPTPMSVLILGASGTGKEYVARTIHTGSSRADQSFVAIDCGALPRDLAASELFGHVKGAFTGADADKIGAFEAADGGTLFLDEVGNLSYDVQVQLLRAIQERRIRPVGATREIPVDIRLVSATNSNLAREVADGHFREDLYHRLNEFTIYMPELKDRGNDIFLFADLFINRANEELQREVLGLDARAAEMLARHSWPGNLRELNNVMKRAVLMAQGEYITAEELGRSMLTTPESVGVMPLHDEHEEWARICEALRSAGGNKSKAARILGIDRKTLYNKLSKYGSSDES